MRRALFSLVAVVVAAVALAAATVGVASGSPEPGSTANRGRAIADARRRLSSFVPPSDSRRVASLPRSLRLGGPDERPASPRYVDVHALWISSEPVSSVRAFLRKDAPPGSRLLETGESGDREGTYLWDYGYIWPGLPNVADSRRLLVGVVARPGGGSALRADAQATYLEPKPKDEKIPVGAGYLEAEEVLGAKMRVVGTADAAKIEATARLLDGFPVVQRNGPEECGLIPSEQVTLKGTFRASAGGPILAETEQQLPAGYCDYIDLTIDGKRARPLFDQGEGLIKSLQNLLGRKYKPPLLTGIEERDGPLG